MREAKNRESKTEEEVNELNNKLKTLEVKIYFFHFQVDTGCPNKNGNLEKA